MISQEDKARLVVGKKQVVKTLEADMGHKVFIASDADDDIREKIESILPIGGEVYYIPTMKELGRMCGIETGASCAVVKKQNL